ncbi:hypothetical protein PPERSA_05958 [Pseudocohnilembus persalinus]|uniref:Uncharacterized protein n=1 Tax=Pseudocohnilembus persalinus TaxID=266149 RepID=A0A0V0R476_PSEPJ|nr:hypothetical protein PPERSA_05958 [Pseudocohnilembus persalinus]|eukprot:KRX09289.1 hypothetical protein PPERSA_05958 [Pseudocohnilembus persalinus]
MGKDGITSVESGQPIPKNNGTSNNFSQNNLLSNLQKNAQNVLTSGLTDTQQEFQSDQSLMRNNKQQSEFLTQETERQPKTELPKQKKSFIGRQQQQMKNDLNMNTNISNSSIFRAPRTPQNIPNSYNQSQVNINNNQNIKESYLNARKNKNNINQIQNSSKKNNKNNNFNSFNSVSSIQKEKPKLLEKVQNDSVNANFIPRNRNSERNILQYANRTNKTSVVQNQNTNYEDLQSDQMSTYSSNLRQNQYTPYNYKSYKNIMSKDNFNFHSLGINKENKEYQKQKEKQERMKQFSENLRKQKNINKSDQNSQEGHNNSNYFDKPQISSMQPQGFKQQKFNGGDFVTMDSILNSKSNNNINNIQSLFSVKNIHQISQSTDNSPQLHSGNVGSQIRKNNQKKSSYFQFQHPYSANEVIKEEDLENSQYFLQSSMRNKLNQRNTNQYKNQSQNQNLQLQNQSNRYDSLLNTDDILNQFQQISQQRQWSTTNRNQYNNQKQQNNSIINSTLFTGNQINNEIFNLGYAKTASQNQFNNQNQSNLNLGGRFKQYTGGNNLIANRNQDQNIVTDTNKGFNNINNDDINKHLQFLEQVGSYNNN